MARTMTAAEYLVTRGWTVTAEDPRTREQTYADPLDQNIDAVGEEDALAIQRARDAEEERKAWVAFAAARLSVNDPQCSGADSCALSPTIAAEHADRALAAYRARFAVEVA